MKRLPSLSPAHLSYLGSTTQPHVQVSAPRMVLDSYLRKHFPVVKAPGMTDELQEVELMVSGGGGLIIDVAS